jgi:hypothetical protein
MLRRRPTSISLTSEDTAAYTEFLRRRAAKLKDPNNPENSEAMAATVPLDPSDELRPLPGEKARIVRTREERIGVGQRG